MKYIIRKKLYFVFYVDGGKLFSSQKSIFKQSNSYKFIVTESQILPSELKKLFKKCKPVFGIYESVLQYDRQPDSGQIGSTSEQTIRQRI